MTQRIWKKRQKEKKEKREKKSVLCFSIHYSGLDCNISLWIFFCFCFSSQALISHHHILSFSSQISHSHSLLPLSSLIIPLHIHSLNDKCKKGRQFSAHSLQHGLMMTENRLKMTNSLQPNKPKGGNIDII